MANGDLIGSPVSVITLLSYAYNVPSNPSPRLIGLPDWMIFEKYDIIAKTPARSQAIHVTSPEIRRQEQQLIRSLLADRFKLAMRVENKRMAVYALVIAAGGPKLLTSTATSPNCILDTNPDGCHSFIIGFGHPLHAGAVDIDDIAHYIENWTDLPVVDRTALKGLFTVNTEGWAPMRLPPPPLGVTPTSNPFAGLPTIFTILKRLGLELQRQDDILPVYTVEHIERPIAMRQ